MLMMERSQRDPSRERRWMLLARVSGAILVAGVLCYALLFFYVNRTLPRDQVYGDPALVDSRLALRGAAEKILVICVDVGLIGDILLLWNLARAGAANWLKRVLSCYVIQFAGVSAVLLLFMVIDKEWAKDYRYWIMQIGLYMLVLAVVAAATFAWTRIRHKR